MGRNPETSQAVVMMPDCGLWSCPYCAEQKKYHWMLRAFKGATEFLADGQEMSFITLTSRGGNNRTRDNALSAFKRAWPKLRKRATYANGKFEYLAIPEQHKNGIIHLHLVAVSGLKKRFWKDNAYETGLGYMADVVALSDTGYVPSYVAKYLGKQFCRVIWPEHFRRARTSKAWPELTEPNAPLDFIWEIFRSPVAVQWEIYFLQDSGYTVSVSERLQFIH